MQKTCCYLHDNLKAPVFVFFSLILIEDALRIYKALPRESSVSIQEASVSRKFGIDFVGSIPWGTHLCQFYKTKKDLTDILVPYFAEGLRNNEFCMWITSPPLEVQEAKNAFRKVAPELDEYIRKGQIEIISYADWYLLDGKFDADIILQGWVEKEKVAIENGYEGLRLSGNTFWIERPLWNSFVDYEEAVNAVIGKHRMIALCTYCLGNCSGSDVVDVVRNHVGTLIKQDKNWTLVENAVERKKADEEIIRLASFPALNPSPVLEVDANCCILYSNPATKSTFPGIEKLGENHPLLSGIKQVIIAIRNESTQRAFCREVKVGDAWFYQYFYLIPSTQRVQIYAFNIDELKRTQQELHESEQRWAATLSSIGDGVIATDSSGQITFMNNTAEALTGWTLNEAYKKPTKVVFNIINEQTRHEVEDPIAKVIEKGIIVGLANNTVLIRKDGTEVAIDDSGAPIKDKTGNTTGVVLVFRDRTMRKQMEKKLEEYAKNLEGIVEERTKALKDSERLAAIGATAGMVGHDIRNPLQTIIGELYLEKSEVNCLSEGNTKTSLLESITAIEEQLQYVCKIVSDLQDFAKPTVPCLEIVDVRKLMNDVLSELKIPDNVQVVCSIEQDFKKLMTDQAAIKRILSNLSLNALQAMPNGGKLSLTAFHKDGGTFISVEDTGMGITKENKDKLFTPLFTTKSKGQGFGLAVVKKLTEALNGKVTVESKVGKGSKFTLQFL